MLRNRLRCELAVVGEDAETGRKNKLLVLLLEQLRTFVAALLQSGYKRSLLC